MKNVTKIVLVAFSIIVVGFGYRLLTEELRIADTRVPGVTREHVIRVGRENWWITKNTTSDTDLEEMLVYSGESSSVEEYRKSVYSQECGCIVYYEHFVEFQPYDQVVRIKGVLYRFDVFDGSYVRLTVTEKREAEANMKKMLHIRTDIFG